MQMVECVEKLFLRTFFSDDKLDVIDEQHVIVPVFFPEFCHRQLAAGLT